MYPDTITGEGGEVTFYVQVAVPASELPVTITRVVSDVFGDVSDASNPLIRSTGCVLPVEWTKDSSFGWALGWGCEFEVLLEGGAQSLSTLLSVTIRLGDGTEVVVNDVAELTVSDELGAIHGTLVDSVTGEPVPDVIVFSTTGPFSAFAALDGTFALEGLPPGDYRLGAGNTEHAASDHAFEYYDDALDAESATPITVVGGQVTSLEWPLSRGGVISGTVTDEGTGEPLERILVVAVGVPVSQETDSDGNYTFRGLGAGSYVVCFVTGEPECWNDVPNSGRDVSSFEGDPVSVELGEHVSGIDAALPWTPVPGPLPATGSSSAWPVTLGLAAIAVGVGVVRLSLRRT